MSLAAYAIVILGGRHQSHGAGLGPPGDWCRIAASLGRLFLRERLGARRLAACTIVALGAACLGYAQR